MKNNLYNHNAWNRQGFIWLCSYPGCGNSFARYILETLFKKPTAASKAWSLVEYGFSNPGKNHPAGPRPLGDFDTDVYCNFDLMGTPIALKSHTIPADKKEIASFKYDVFKDEWSHESPVILLLRDFNECAIGRIYRRGKSFIEDSEGYSVLQLLPEDVHYELSQYLNILKNFDSHSGNKILIRYEDLMGDTHSVRKTITKISKFVIDNHFEEISSSDVMSNIDTFIENIESHIKNSRLVYVPRCNSGDNNKFYQDIITTTANSKITETVLNDMELFCRRFDSVLFDKYLKVYT